MEIDVDFRPVPNRPAERLPNRKEKENAYNQLVKSPESAYNGENTGSEFEKKTLVLSLLIIQNQEAGRLSFLEGVSEEFMKTIRARKAVQEEGTIPENIEELNEIAYRHSELNPNIDTLNGYFTSMKSVT